jgi:MFS transporter, FSR family, fosmidomycin resistance protein
MMSETGSPSVHTGGRMNHRLVGLLSSGHFIADVSQGALPALLPFLITEHHLSYAAAAGLVFAMSAASTLVQPLFGHVADRFSKPSLLILAVLLAGSGVALTGILPSYRLIVLAVAISGIGVAAFHPEAARLTNYIAGEKKTTAMSIFAIGGSLGFAAGPLIITAALAYWELKGTLFLIVPVLLVAVALASHLSHFSEYGKPPKGDKSPLADERSPDAWAPFTRLAMVGTFRSIIFYGLNTFIPLYWIHVLHQSNARGGTALTILFASGVVGGLLGGRLADHFGSRKVIVTSFCVLIPLLPLFASVNHIPLATGLLVPMGLALSSIYSPVIVLGQKYLPNHIGLASGVTLGVAVAVGGMVSPLLGRLADLHGIRMTLTIVAFLPLLAAGLALTLPRPKSNSSVHH